MKIFRKRYIPDEIVDISSDEVLKWEKNLIVTKWIPIKPREVLGSGISYTMLDKGWKISRFIDKNGNFMYWYCDIITYNYDETTDTYTIIDLLVDLEVYEDGSYKVLDMDELLEACEKNIITVDQKNEAIEKLNALIDVVKKGEFPPAEEVK